VTRRRIARICLVIGAIYSAALVGPGSAGTERARTMAGCPSSAVPGGPFDVEAVVAAVRRELPKLYRGLTDMGEPVPINPRTYQIDGVVRLGFPPVRGFAQALRSRALRLCRRAVVDRSWAVVVALTRVQLPASNRVVFLAKTSKGWSAWYHD
jgi:hypothetical protein